MVAALDTAARAASAGHARASATCELPPVMAAAFRAHATIQAYEAARSLASEYERAKDKLAKGVLRTDRDAAVRSAPTPMTTPGAPPARRAARWRT